MDTTFSNTLVKHSENRNLVLPKDRYYINRLTNLAEIAIEESQKLHEEARLVVFDFLQEAEQIMERSQKILTPQKERLIEICLRNYLLEIIDVLQRTNREMAYTLAGAGSDLDNEFVVKKQLSYLKWQVSNLLEAQNG